MRGALMAGMAGLVLGGKLLRRAVTADRQRASGLTLVEVLSTVFIMGLGLIMVAAAFPVGIDQVRRAVDDTQSAMAARSAVELLHGQNVFQNMTKVQWDDLVSSGKTWPHGENASSNYYRVHNPWRQLYVDNQTTTAMWPPEPGDLLWRAFLTRLTDTDEMPLFRVTIVVVKYSRQSPELYLPNGSPDTVSSRTLTVNSSSDNRCKAPPNQVAKVAEGDYLMDPYTGFCYRVVNFDTNNRWLELATEPDPRIPNATDCGVFGSVVGIYYTMISG